MKVQGRVFKWQPSTWQSILCPWDKAAAQFPPKDSSGHPQGQLCGGDCKVLAAVEGLRTALHPGKQVQERWPLQVLVRGLPPALNAPVNWEPAG